MILLFGIGGGRGGGFNPIRINPRLKPSFDMADQTRSATDPGKNARKAAKRQQQNIEEALERERERVEAAEAEEARAAEEARRRRRARLARAVGFNDTLLSGRGRDTLGVG